MKQNCYNKVGVCHFPLSGAWLFKKDVTLLLFDFSWNYSILLRKVNLCLSVTLQSKLVPH